jgi:hypothetical protein
MFRLIPSGWKPSSFKTIGDLEQWRTSLRALGVKLAIVSIFSFSCKSLLVSLQFFNVVSAGSATSVSLSTILVEAIPSTLTVILLFRYHSGSLSAARSSSLGVSLISQVDQA